MTVFSSATPGPQTDGIAYAVSKIVPATEADLYNAAVQPAGGPDPAVLVFHAAIVASVSLVISGGPSGNTTYIVMEGSLADGAWYDLAWALSTSTSNGTYNFLLSAGVAGSNAFAQTRANGTAPGSTGSNQCVIPGRIRFTGQSTLTGGTAPAVKASITYRLVPLR